MELSHKNAVIGVWVFAFFTLFVLVVFGTIGHQNNNREIESVTIHLSSNSDGHELVIKKATGMTRQECRVIEELVVSWFELNEMSGQFDMIALAQYLGEYAELAKYQSDGEVQTYVLASNRL